MIQQMFMARSANSAQVLGDVVATGGTVYTDGNFKVHLFSASGTFSVSDINNSNASLSVLVVGGGQPGGVGGSAFNDFDGRPGGLGGNGALSRIYSGLSFGSYFNKANYTVTVGGPNTDASQVGNKTGTAFVCTGGQIRKIGGSDGFNGTGGAPGADGYLNTWGFTFYYGAGGGGGGGGGNIDNTSGGTGGGGGASDGGSGGFGGNYFGAGDGGAHATWYGNGGGGGGGAGSNDESGVFIAGGAAGNGSAGVVLIRYQFK